MNSSQSVDSEKKPEIYQNGYIIDKDVLDFSADSTISDVKYPNSGVAADKRSILKMVLIGIAIAAIFINIILTMIVIGYVATDSKQSDNEMKNMPNAGALGGGSAVSIINLPMTTLLSLPSTHSSLSSKAHSSLSTSSLLEVTSTSTSPSVSPSSNAGFTTDPPSDEPVTPSPSSNAGLTTDPPCDDPVTSSPSPNINQSFDYNFNITLAAVQDVWLESGSANGNVNFLIIGKHPHYPKKRSLLQFENLPNNCTSVASAKMYIWYWYSHKASWLSAAAVPVLSHTFKVHQVKKEWIESQATSSHRKYGISWSQSYLGLDGTDADANYTDSVYFPNPPPSGNDNRWIEFDITVAAQNWANGQPNYGVIVWSNRENDSGRDVRFYSHERSTNKPYVRLTCQ